MTRTTANPETNGKTRSDAAGACSGHGAKYPRLRDKAILCILNSPTLQVAADETGVSLQTLKRWLRRPKFKQRLREARDEVYEQGLCRLLRLLEKAANALARATTCGATRNEIAAASAIFSNVVKMRDTVDLKERMEEVERVLREKGYIQ